MLSPSDKDFKTTSQKFLTVEKQKNLKQTKSRKSQQRNRRPEEPSEDFRIKKHSN